MTETKAVAIVGMGAILPDAPDVATFWKNILGGRYSISDVTADRWRTDFYFDPDPSVPDKTYTKIGGWVRGFTFAPLQWGIPIPPKMQQTMDEAQQWAIAAARQALMDYGYPNRSLDNERVAVILGNAMAGEGHYKTSLRIHLPEYVDALAQSPAFQLLPPELQQQVVQGMVASIQSRIPAITEDTMPGELGNIIAGRVANVFNFGGPNFVTDAACASSLAALQSAVEGLNSYKFDAVLTGGVDRNMGPESFVKFSKIGALSPDGSRPYADGANGFVMGEGASIFLMKRLADAERDGDKIYAVVRGIGSSSDGKGKGITAPNPIGQQRAIERAWKDAGVAVSSVGLVEGHGTSTKVGDVVEVTSLNAIFGPSGLPRHTVALGSVKSNIGHLKSAAGAAGMMKVAMALYEKTLPPSVNFHRPNPNIPFGELPFFVNTQAQPWQKPAGEIRRAGVSSFGFGGTNFHVVVEEHVPGLLTSENRVFVVAQPAAAAVAAPAPVAAAEAVAVAPKPYRGLLFVGAESVPALRSRVAGLVESVRGGQVPPSQLPSPVELRKPERLVIDYGSPEELLKRLEKSLKTFDMDSSAAWQAMTAQGVYRGSGKAGKVAFLFPGQGSQYANMLRDLAEVEPVVAETYREADAVMTPILGRPLTSYIFSADDEESIQEAEKALKNTVITQPAVLTANVALLRLMQKFGFAPDLVIGHSLGEYAALVASGVLSFAEALEVVSARGREMSKIKVDDNGCMAAVSAPIAEVERILAGINGYVVIANINSPLQCVIAGATGAVEASIAAFTQAGFQAVKIPVSHAFHTQIVAPASEPLRRVIERMNVQSPRVPIAANVTGKLYPHGREEILDLLAQQVASPVQFIQGITTLYENGVRVFVEVGPKRVLNALAADILKDTPDVAIFATNHPRKGGIPSFSEALCGLYAAGVNAAEEAQPVVAEAVAARPAEQPVELVAPIGAAVELLKESRQPLTGSVVISGAGLGLPGRSRRVFDDSNVERLLKGEVMIEALPEDKRTEMVNRRVTRLEKSEAGALMLSIDSLDGTLKLAGQGGGFDPREDFGIPTERVDSWDISTQLAVAAGIEALRDAGIPLVMGYRQTSKGTYLPNRWMLPEGLADETGVIFASAFPGLDQMASEAGRFYEYQNLKQQAAELRGLAGQLPAGDARGLIERRAAEIESQVAALDYHFDRRFIFRILAMGHSQFAEFIGARGPNTHVNAACATTTHAVAVAEDWIRAGRCRRVVIIAGDDVTEGSLVDWVGTGLLASGASTTEGNLRMAALPFDRRRNGMIPGMGAAALVLEAEDAVRERGMRGICELLSAQIANSAFHGTRLDVPHVSEVMERVVAQAEARFGIQRGQIAAETVFVSHETYTPARGGSAAAEIAALRKVFGEQANRVVIANTKGFTGHTMGVGVEDVVAVKALEYRRVPPIAHYDEQFEPDPDLGDLNLSRGGEYPVQFALRLGAGFGSQIAMTLVRRVAGVGERVNQPLYRQWLAAVAGYEQAELEVVQRTLRIQHAGPPVRKPAQSTWRMGQGPRGWANLASGQAVQLAPVAYSQNGHHPVTEAAKQEVAVAPAPVTVAAPAQPVVAGSKEIEAYILQVVAEKTGYPTDMLDLELDLEGDLGIDTVKQAELFREIREHYGIPRREDLRLADYNTLQKVIGFVQAGLGAQAAPAPQAATAEPTPAAPQPVAAGTQQADVQAFVVALVSEKTGYPAEMLDLGLDLEGDLGIDTVKQAELFRAVREQYGIPRREDLRLADYNTLEKVIGFVMDAAGSQPASPTPVVMAAPVAAPASVAVTPQPPAAAQPVAPVVTADEDVTAYVLGVVAEKTGYPTEMLDLDLDLEGDLGVDTVKQAELFATIRTHYGIPRREDLRLSDYNTLRKVVGFMQTAVNPASAVESVVAAAPVEPPAVEAQPVAAGGRDDEIKAYVLSVVAEKTGYPVEMLDLELDLEGDLGIDTVKQAEVFATIRTHFGIPRREDLRLADYNTLEKVIGFMADALAPAPVEPEPPAPEPVAAEAAPEAPAVSAEPTEPVAIRRRVPVAVLRPRIELCEPTGIELGPESRVLIVADGGKVADSLARRLRGRKAQVLVAREDAVAQASAWAAEAPLTGVYFLRGLESPSSLADLTVEAWESERTNSLENLASLLREQTTLQFLVVATRMGGLHGVLGAAQPLNGLLTGFAKAVAMERPGLRVKAVDFEADLADSPLAARLVDETLSDPAVVEVGWEAEQRFTLVLQDQMVTAPARAVESGSVFLVSGGTGGITAPIVADLARRTQGKFYLTGRTQLTDRNDPDLAHLKEDRAGLKKALAERMSQAGAKVTPAQVERRVAELERSAAAWEAIGAVEAAGGAATYLAGDVSDAASVAALVQQVLDREGRVDVLIHAAGQDRSRKLENKSAEEFRGIVNVKAGGFLNLWRALAERGRLPRQVVAFTSVAGRFGNSGQTDYAAANDAVSKMIHAIRREHPQVQATAIDWGAWAEVGMASRGFIPELMQRAGIEMMAPEQAAPLVFAELTGGQGGEVVLSGKLGALEAQSSPTGGLNVERANQALTEGNPIHVMLSRATGLSLTEGVLLEAELHPDEPFLRDHALNGIPLLPGVMGIEGFSIAAQHVSSVLGSAKGGFRVDELEDVHFLAPFKLYRNQSRRITWKAQVVREVGGLVAHVRLESTLALKTRPDEVVQHFSGKVHLAPVQVALESAIVAPPVWNGAYTVQPEDIYKLYFHGPAFQVLDGVQRSGDSVLGKLNKNLPGLTSEENRMVSTPVLVELCLQTAGIWEVGATGTLALPRSIGCLKLYRTRVNGVPIFAEVVPTRDENGALSFDARVVDAKGHLYLELNNYRTVPLPYSVESDLLSPLKGLMETH